MGKVGNKRWESGRFREETERKICHVFRGIAGSSRPVEKKQRKKQLRKQNHHMYAELRERKRRLVVLSSLPLAEMREDNNEGLITKKVIDANTQRSTSSI